MKDILPGLRPVRLRRGFAAALEDSMEKSPDEERTRSSYRPEKSAKDS